MLLAGWLSKEFHCWVKIVALLESERGGEGGQSAELSHCPRSRSRRRRSEDRRNDAVLLYSTDRCAPVPVTLLAIITLYK